MSYKYSVIAKIDMTGFPGINDMVTTVNDCMQGFGYSEKLVLESEAQVMEMTTGKLLTVGDKVKAIEIMQQQFDNNELLKKFRIIEISLI